MSFVWYILPDLIVPQCARSDSTPLTFEAVESNKNKTNMHYDPNTHMQGNLHDILGNKGKRSFMCICNFVDMDLWSYRYRFELYIDFVDMDLWSYRYRFELYMDFVDMDLWSYR
jgi:hypothetical protein